MPLYLPPALSLNRLDGGYNSTAEFNTLQDTQTNDAKNSEILRNGNIRERRGYVRLLNTALCKTGLKVTTGEDGDEINGHYQLKKSGFTSEEKYHIVGAGSNLWSYTSATANILLQGLDADGQWNFTQIQDPRSASDDIIVGVNGYQNPVIWNGTDASASYLSDVSGASGVQIAKYIVSVKGRIILGNINDTSDVDSNSKFIFSGFSSEGTPTPHVFPTELQAYAGGSDRYGGITGMAPLNGNVVIFKNNTTYYFNIGGGTTIDPATLSVVHDFSLQQLDENIGCIAPKSIATIGNAVIFLSDYGVYAFDGAQFTYIGQGIEEDLKDINFARKKEASGVFHRDLNEYWLSVAASGKNYNNVIFRYDVTRGVWHPPANGMKANILSNFREGNQEKILAGDHLGYIYELNKGTADGFERGHNVYPSTVTGGDTLNIKDSQALATDGDGYLGIGVYAIGVTGSDETMRVITNATGTQVVVDNPYSTMVDSGTEFSIAGINSHFKTKDYPFENADLDKMYRQVTVRAKQFGDFSFKTQYIIDFNEISNAGTATISQYNQNFLTWDASGTGTNTNYSGTIETVSVGTSEITVSGCSGLPTAGSGLTGYVVQLFNSGTRYLRPIASNDSGVLQLGLYGTQSEVAVNSDTSYFINTNLAGTMSNARWGPTKTKINQRGIRFMNNQPAVGKYFALRFVNQYANQPWEIHGFDILTRSVGRRN